MKYFPIDLGSLKRLVLLSLVLCVSLGCSEENSTSMLPVDGMADVSAADAAMPDSTTTEDAESRVDGSAANDAMTADAAIVDATTVDAAMDAAVVDAAVVDAAVVDAVVADAAVEPPTGPIAPPAGRDTTPEEADFDWSGVANTYISRSIPSANIDWSEYPRAGRARVLAESDSDECVCFNVECSVCSQDECSAETCTYDLNANHTLTKYHVELTSIEDAQHVVTFEVNVSADPAIEYTNIADVLNRFERVPVPYWYGLKVITQFGRGIQFLHGSYFNGAAAYGSMNYIDTQTAQLPTILHELGHTFEQYTRIGHPPALEPQSNILDPIWRHGIRSDNTRTSRYGDNNEWEDLAEFARIYALAIIEDSLARLQELSPERYRTWERILLNGATIAR
jgi:hypothetical protein